MQSGRIAGVLGPTNTGKTHYAIERMLAHRTGIIGLPLRLLAREVYDKIVAVRGPSVVALLTGEERIIPPRVQYWVCTVEAMPQNNGVDFVAIDEIQLCADPERGHVFTQRLISARGLNETLFLGADTMRGPILHLIPEAIFIRRERLSNLIYAGSKKISRMPTRSAIVGFSVDNVYAMAELLRRQKGGAAVVLGALSPRTRNAQVELYQNGEVDYLVATDAIGMGLNLDVHHVAFSGLSKFDGRRMRPLAANELAQIAGRAGRGMADGSFGVTGDVTDLDEGVANAIVNHRFTPIKRLNWRNSDLAFSNVDILIERLGIAPTNEVFIKARDADDLIALKNLAERPEIRARTGNPSSVKLLWDVCRIPDFRGISPAEHANLLGIIFNNLHENGELPKAWLARQINLIDRIDGDIDTLSKRLAFIRTWTYVAQNVDWLEDVGYWREATRTIEDRLSDALHNALTKRFVDRRTSVLLRRLKQKECLLADVNDNGEVTVEGEFVGQLEGFRFIQDKNATGTEAKTLKTASLQALMPHFNLRADRLYNAPDTELNFTDQGGLIWGEHAVGKLALGDDPLKPLIIVFVDDTAGTDVIKKVQRRLQHFIDRKIASLFEPLISLQRDEALSGLARGFAFRMVEGFGILPRSNVADEVKALDQDARGMLRKHGVRFGQFTIFMPLLLKPAATRLRILLWSLFRKLDEFPISPPPGLVTIPVDSSAPEGYDLMAGYRNSNTRAIRIDMLERLADMIRVQDTRSGFEANPDMLSITGMTLEQFSDLLQGLGYNAEKLERDKVKPDKTRVEAVRKTEASTESADLVSKDDAHDTVLQNAEAEKSSGPVVDPSLGDQFSSDQTLAARESGDIEVVKAQALSLAEDLVPVEKETYFIFTWSMSSKTKPKPNRPKRELRKADDQGSDKSRSKGKRNQNKEVEKSKTNQSKPEKTKKIDPDNPFVAALIGLKIGK
tara:strand:+ start:1996 stop:4875 length:2880 start_codon:yes stop_codon:yes gene_type:complete